MHKNYKDVFNSFLVSLAYYDGYYEFPKIKPVSVIPNRLIPFSKALSCKEYDQWIHFYEYDYMFERVWRNPERYLKLFKKYNGVILPDFSTYRDMPLVMQLWNIYRSRALGVWLQRNGITVIPNVRYGDYRTFSYSCDGIAKHCTIAVGSNGTMKHRQDREIFLQGLDYIVARLQPSTIVVYGTVLEKRFEKYRACGITIVVFESDYATSRKEVV